MGSAGGAGFWVDFWAWLTGVEAETEPTVAPLEEAPAGDVDDSPDSYEYGW